MKLYFSLIVIVIATAFSTGYFALFIQGVKSSSKEDTTEINRLVTQFFHQAKPHNILDFDSLYFSKGGSYLIDPMFSLERATKEQAIFATKKDCFTSLPNLLTTRNFAKVFMWEEFRCGQRARLPNRYFSVPPFIHPAGHSYAYLAFVMGRRPFNGKRWARKHVSYFHVSELEKVKDSIGKLGGVYDLLVSLGKKGLGQIGRGQKIVMASDYILKRIGRGKVSFQSKYEVYNTSDLMGFAIKTPYILRPYIKEKGCFYRWGELCWDYNPRHIVNIINRSYAFIFVGLFLAIGIVAWILFKKIKQQKLEDERKRLALQTLTHEFRTPVTSLLLQLEELNKKFNQFDGDTQESFLRMSNDIHRLQRLAQMSRNYLKFQEGEHLVELNEEYVDDINYYLEEQFLPYKEGSKGEFVFKGLKQTMGLMLDPYWFGICLKNLIENAFVHGKAPVKVSLFQANDEVVIKVQDAGKCQFSTIEEMCQEFVKGNQSKGSGLGLNIVAKVVKEMNGELTLSKNPTTIALKIKIKGQDHGKHIAS